jgi:hypothetical protein
MQNVSCSYSGWFTTLSASVAKALNSVAMTYLSFKVHSSKFGPASDYQM